MCELKKSGDEPHILQSINRLLRRDGYEVHLADNGPAALEILVKTAIAVIICDQRMPAGTNRATSIPCSWLYPEILYNAGFQQFTVGNAIKRYTARKNTIFA